MNDKLIQRNLHLASIDQTQLLFSPSMFLSIVAVDNIKRITSKTLS